MLFEIRRRRLDGLQISELLQKPTIGCIVFLDTTLDCGQFAIANFGRAPGLIALLDNRFLFCIQFCDGFILLPRILFAFGLDLF